jgi:hypothetical protein
MPNTTLAAHELLCLYLKSFYGLERSTPATLSGKSATKPRPARRKRGRRVI